jgi:hypothetical protein
MAQLAMSSGYDVRDYVATALGFIQKAPAYITPKDLVTPAVCAMYEDARRQRNNQDKYQHLWNSQKDLVTQMQAVRPDTYTTLYTVLISSWSPFEAWFRVMYPDPVDPDLYTRYSRLAWEELQDLPGLRAMLYKLRPASMEMLQKQYGYFGDASPPGAT